MRHGRKDNSRWQKFPAPCSVSRKPSPRSSPAVAADGGVGKRQGAAFVRCCESRALPGEPGWARPRQPGLREGDKCQGRACQKHRKYVAKLLMMLWGFPLSRAFYGFFQGKRSELWLSPSPCLRTNTQSWHFCILLNSAKRLESSQSVFSETKQI